MPKTTFSVSREQNAEVKADCRVGPPAPTASFRNEGRLVFGLPLFYFQQKTLFMVKLVSNDLGTRCHLFLGTWGLKQTGRLRQGRRNSASPLPLILLGLPQMEGGQGSLRKTVTYVVPGKETSLVFPYQSCQF